jgi:ABC-type branched-subunit amino acid transport system ATPase component/predicted MFS family arabinose efflux permease
MTQPDAANEAASLAGAVLTAEAERQATQRGDEVLLADDLLPGVGDERITLREGLLAGGAFTFVVLLLLNALEQLENASLSVLAPDIRDTFHVGSGVIVFISGASGAFLVLGALPMGWLADRHSRPLIIGISSILYSVMVFACGLAMNVFTLFLGRFGVGIAKSNTLPVHGSLLADAYPISIRGRMSGTIGGVGLLVGALSPALVGGIAALAGGIEGWRWAYFVLGIPVLLVAFLAFRIPEPPRGQYEMLDVLGEVVDATPPPMSTEAVFSRLNQIRTIRTCMLAFAAIGFGLFTGPVLANLYLEDHFGLSVGERGLLTSFGAVVAALALPFAARAYDDRFRTDPEHALRLVGYVIIPVAILVPVQYAMPNVWLFAIASVFPGMLLMVAFTMVGPVLQSVTPYRLRGMGAALGAIYVFFGGATLGSLLAAFFTDALGARGAVLLLVPPSTLVGGLLVLRSSRFIKNDLSMAVGELREELEEQRRRLATPEAVPALHVHGIDFSYGHVQVLFDVGFEVRPGEVLALLGTNGAGKSTILRVIAGLGTPSRGVIRLDGTTITFVSPERRGSLGIRLLPGGKGVFPQMTVRENLEMAAFVYRHDAADQQRRIGRVLELFDDLAGRAHQPAGSLSGGQQQMLALGGTLLHEPRVLLIDELSLGLSPIMVEQLLRVVERLKAEGTTVVIVEQSLNVALAIADRAVFLEKGEVRFEGAARELLERDDLARAVFLGREGG